MSAIIETTGLGKRYRRRSALRDCTLAIPAGKVVGLVGPNGAGKTTLLHLVVGLLGPTSGAIDVMGRPASDNPLQLARIGFVAQDAPLYARLSVEQHLSMGAWLNPGWDDEVAERRIEQVGLDPHQRAGSLSGGERSTRAHSGDCKAARAAPARRATRQLGPAGAAGVPPSLMEFVAGGSTSVVLSSHLLADLERVCDHLIVIVKGRVQLAGDIGDLLASHHRLSGPHRDPESLPSGQEVIEESHVDKQSTFLVRSEAPILDPAWTVTPVTLDDLVLAYMRRAREGKRSAARPARSERLEVVR